MYTTARPLTLPHARQIPTYLETLDRIDQILDPVAGLLGVVDFYATDEAGSTPRERAIGTARRKVPFLASLFWKAWFSFDHVHLDIARRSESVAEERWAST